MVTRARRYVCIDVSNIFRFHLESRASGRCSAGTCAVRPPPRIPVQDSTPIPKSAAKSRTPASIELFHSCFGAGCEAGLFLLHILPPDGVLEFDIFGRVPLNSFWKIGGPYDGKTRNRRGGPRCILFGGAKTWRIGCSC